MAGTLRKNPMHVIIAIVAAATVSAATAASAVTFKLMPHRAIYSVSLESARSGSGIAAVRGEMFADWAETCVGWSLDHRSRLDVTYSPGRTIRLTVSVATWESRDGLNYRFNICNSANGSVTERIEGRATLSAADRSGQVIYDVPAGRVDELPAGTVFPTTHSVRILEAAHKASTLVAMPVFDGMTLEGAFTISAFLGRGLAPAREIPNSLDALEGRQSRPLRMAFFPVAGHAAEPSHEIGMTMYDNGVGEDPLLEFGDFTVRARLIRLEMKERPSCGA